MTEQQIKEFLEKGKEMGLKLGVLQERTRILKELEKIGIQPEVWKLIRPIFIS